MNWLREVLGHIRGFWGGFSTPIYDQGYEDGYKAGKDAGHDHGECEHSHPFEEDLLVLGEGRRKELTGDRMGGYF